MLKSMSAMEAMAAVLILEILGLLCLVLIIMMKDSRGPQSWRAFYLQRRWKKLVPRAARGDTFSLDKLRPTLSNKHRMRAFQHFIDQELTSSGSRTTARTRTLVRDLGFTEWLEDVVQNSHNELERAGAARTLQRLHEQVDTERLEELLHSKDPAVVISAGYMIAATKEASLFYPVLLAVYKQTQITMHGAAELLSRFGPKICPQMRQLLGELAMAQERGFRSRISPDDVGIQVIMIDLLAFFGSGRAAKTLSRLMDSTPHEEVLIHIVKALAIIGSSGDAAELIRLLSHSNWVIRSQSAIALATLGASQALPEIETLLEDSDHHVRLAAERALGILALEPELMKVPA